jgi:sec-independent protein translocase protein TatC
MQEEQRYKKKNKPQNPNKEMSFWEHLEELRWHLFRIIIVVLIIAIAAFLNRHYVFDVVILAPKDSSFITNQLLCKVAELFSIERLCIDNLSLEIINISMSGQFMTHMYISIAAGILLSFPYILFELWRFIAPALHPREKKYSSGAVWVSSFLFLLGVLFSYFLIVPLTINFLGTYQVSDFVENTISLSSYISTVVSVTFAVGLVFELPILVYFLTKLGVLTPHFMKKNRKVMIVIVLILSAIITPPDVFSQILVGLPLLALYEISIGISKRVYARQQKLAG